MSTTTEAPDRPVRLGRRGLLLAAVGTAAAAAGAVPVVRALGGSRVPTSGPALPTLPEVASTRSGGVRVAALTAVPSATGMAYNGSTPGPLLRLREGERVRVDFTNDTDADSSLHLHGVPLAPAVDRPLAHLAPGESDTREFEVPRGSAGTYWYHPHAHGDVERQLLAGLAGPVVVEGPADRLPGLADAGDVLVMFTRVGDTVVANGLDQPMVTARRGRTRLRLLNATPGDHLLVAAVQDGRPVDLHLVATDAGLVDRPEPVEQVLLAPGERAEVLVDTSRAGTIGVQRRPYSTYGPGGDAGEERTLLVVDVPAPLDPVPLPPRLRPVERLDPADAVRTQRLVLGAADSAFTIDGRTFAMGRVDREAVLGTTEVWEVVNEHGSDHPFHLHSYAVQVLDRDGVPEPFPAWRDTVNVPAGSTVRLLVPFRGGAGRTVYHCHIVNHEDLGMMGVLEVRP